MAYVGNFDSYQPSLFIKHVDYRTRPDQIHRILSKLDFGVINAIHVKPPRPGQTLTTAFVSFRYWKTDVTETTRDMLRRGKFLTVYYSDKYFWKIYEYRPKQRETGLLTETTNVSSEPNVERRGGEDVEDGEDMEGYDPVELVSRNHDFLPMTPDVSPPSTPRHQHLSSPVAVKIKKTKKVSSTI